MGKDVKNKHRSVTVYTGSKIRSHIRPENKCVATGSRKTELPKIDILGELLHGADFREPLKRLEAHIDNYDFDEAREPVPEIAGLLHIAPER